MQESFSQLENTYINEKCGISIQYPKYWEAENRTQIFGKLKPIVDISPHPDDIHNTVGVKLWDIADYSKKAIEYVSEVFGPGADEIETEVIQDDIVVVGFPAQKLAYTQGIPGEYEFQEEKPIFWS